MRSSKEVPEVLAASACALLALACGPFDQAHPRSSADIMREEEHLLGDNDGTGHDPVCHYSADDVLGMERSCVSRSRLDCTMSATMYWRGCGVPKDLGHAEELYGRACQLGSIGSCDMQATLMIRREPRALSYVRPLLQYSCDQGSMRGCSNLGIVLVHEPDRTPETVMKGVALLKRACTAEVSFSCEHFAQVAIERKLTAEFEDARKGLKAACGQGQLSACYGFAVSTENGDLGVTDYYDAADTASRACERGHLASCHAVAFMLLRGHGFPRDDRKAAMLLHFACTKGLREACDSLGEALEKGVGVTQNPKLALDYYRFACGMGSESGCAHAHEHDQGATARP